MARAHVKARLVPFVEAALGSLAEASERADELQLVGPRDKLFDLELQLLRLRRQLLELPDYAASLATHRKITESDQDELPF
jgi:hypothetical protein